jgi:hypothetical protein
MDCVNNIPTCGQELWNLLQDDKFKTLNTTFEEIGKILGPFIREIMDNPQNIKEMKHVSWWNYYYTQNIEKYQRTDEFQFRYANTLEESIGTSIIFYLYH